MSYLLSYRNHQGFHEECVEKIFQDINERCEIESLLVRANYLRRGGIEINPVRTTHENYEQILREQDNKKMKDNNEDRLNKIESKYSFQEDSLENEPRVKDPTVRDSET